MQNVDFQRGNISQTHQAKIGTSHFTSYVMHLKLNFQVRMHAVFATQSFESNSSIQIYLFIHIKILI